MTQTYHTHRRLVAGVPDGTPLCSECGAAHERKGQRHFLRCHADYQRKWAGEQRRNARAFREMFHGKQTVSGET